MLSELLSSLLTTAYLCTLNYTNALNDNHVWYQETVATQGQNVCQAPAKNRALLVFSADDTHLAKTVKKSFLNGLLESLNFNVFKNILTISFLIAVF